MTERVHIVVCWVVRECSLVDVSNVSEEPPTVIFSAET
jgi:hypothetical protein